MKTSVKMAFAFMCFTFINCFALVAQTPATKQSGVESITTDPNFLDPLRVGLEGYFRFNTGLADLTGKLTASPSGGSAKYGTDRKGLLQSALYLDGTYGVSIANVPAGTQCSIAAWIKDESTVDALPIGITASGLQVSKLSGTYRGIVSAPNTNIMVSSGAVATGWHLLVVTYDGAALKIYIDGQLKNTTTSAGTIPTAYIGYNLGTWWNGLRWKGYIDDLRFYKRALVASDVQKLYAM